MTAEPSRCADAAEARAESLYGTASSVRRWLLLEQPGSWGRDALLESRLPQRSALELRRRARASGIRIVLIRRGVRLSSAKRQCYFAVMERDERRLTRLELEGFDDLLDLDLTPLVTGADVEGARLQTEPLFLICTHGRHDACCSIRGNQVSRIACAERDLDAWECSHIGGDRFAANVVAFPHGVYYGRVAPEEVLSLAHAYRGGTISLPHYRGRCCYPFPLQAAEYFVRRETDTTGLDDVSLIRSSAQDDRVSATFALSPTRQVHVEVRIDPGSETHRLTCSASRPETIPRYELVRCEVRDELHPEEGRA